MRIGQGFDVHKFAESAGEFQIRLGGVDVAHDHELLAHSDGDVVIHALCDSLLGALALGDIGHHFPDTDPQYAGIDSRSLLRSVYRLINNEGYRLGNTDITIIAEKPRIAAYVTPMRQVLATDLQCQLTDVSVKATSTEKLGFLGRGEGIAAQVVTLVKAI